MSATVERDVSTVNRWLGEGKTLAPHTGRPPYRGGPTAVKEGEAFASDAGLKGPTRLLFLKEVQEGWITPSNLENVTEGALLDWLTKPLAYLAARSFLGGPGAEGAVNKLSGGSYAALAGAGSTTIKRDPKTGKAVVKNNPGIGEKTAAAVPSVGGAIVEAFNAIVKGWGLRLLEIVAGAGLVLFGLYTLAHGTPPKVPAVVPV